MTEISFELADVFKTVRYTDYLSLLEKGYADKFPSWQRIEFDIRELTSTQLHLPVDDKFIYTAWGCKVVLKISRNRQEFYDRIKSSLQFLAEKFQAKR